MADSTNFVINYIVNLKDTQQKVQELARINQKAAQQMGSDFSKAVDLIDRKISKLNTKTIKVPVVNAQGENVGTRLQKIDTTQVTSTIKTADGQLKTFTETVVKTDGAIKTINTSLRNMKQPIQGVTSDVDKFAGKFSGLKTNFTKLSSVNSTFSNELKSFGNVTKFVGTTLNSVSDQGTKISKVFQTASGQFLKLNETSAKSASGIQTVTRSITQLSDKQGTSLRTLEGVNTAFTTGGKTARNFSDNLNTLINRAALTIPVWFAIRQSITSMFLTMKNGVRDILAFDLALQKVKRNLSGTPAEIDANIKKLKEQATAFSLVSGVSVESFTEAVKKFASLGFSFEEALAGGQGAAKLSVVLFGDAAETADSFARALNVLIDRSKGAKSAGEQMNDIFALTAALEKTNQFEISEVNEALKNSAGVFKSLGFNAKETLAILATLGTGLIEGARGGTLASSAIQQLVANLDKVKSTLGIDVNPQLESTSQIFNKVITEIDRLNQTDIVAATKAINDLFGGVKGAKPVRALIADLNRLKDNLQISSSTEQFNKDLNSVLESESSLGKRLTNINKEIGKAFVNGIVGGEDFKASLDSLVKTAEAAVPVLQKMGTVVRGIFSGQVNFVGALDLRKELDKIDLSSIKKLVEKEFKIGELDLPTLKARVDNLELIRSKLDPKVFKELENQLNTRIQELEKSPSAEINLKATVDQPEFRIPEEQRIAIAQKVLDIQLEQLQAAGALGSEILKQKGILNTGLGIDESILDKTIRRLETEKAINEEKRLQNRLSSDSVKLFEIAQTEGVEVAKKIGAVLAGNVDFSSFVRRGGKELEIFKAQFEDIFKSQQAEAFFKGNTVPGLTNLRGGSGIDIQEQAIRGLSTNVSALIQQTKAESQFKNLTLAESKVDRMIVGAISFPSGPIGANTPNVLNNAAITGLPNRTLPSNTPGLSSSLDQLKSLQAQGLLSKNAQISITVDFNGTENVLIGTPESIIGQLSEVAAQKAREATVKALSNSQSPISKAVNNRQEEL